MAQGTFSPNGFMVTANSAIDMIVGTQAAGAGMVSSNIQLLSKQVGLKLKNTASQISAEVAKVASVNKTGFAKLTSVMDTGLDSLSTISGASLAVQAAGFAVTAYQLSALRGDISKLHEDLVQQGQELISLQRVTNSHLETLVDYAGRTLKTQELILDTLVSSRTVEAQQLIRQGWENLKNDYDEDAFARFLKSLDYDNTVYLAHAELARIYEFRKDDVKAEDHYKRAVSFSTSAGGNLAAFARVKYSGFLERKGRDEEAIKLLESALSQEGLDEAQKNNGRFHLAELLAPAPAAPDRSLGILKELIAKDDVFYLATLGSEKLKALQPRVTQLLLDFANERREKGLKLIETAARYRSACVVMGATEESLWELDKACAQTLEDLLLRPYQELPEAISKAEAVLQDFKEKLSAEVDKRVAELQEEHARIAQRARRERRGTWSERIPAPSQPGPPQEGILKALAGAFLIICLILFVPLTVFAVKGGIEYYSSSSSGYSDYSKFVMQVVLASVCGTISIVLVFVLIFVGRKAAKGYKKQMVAYEVAKKKYEDSVASIEKNWEGILGARLQDVAKVKERVGNLGKKLAEGNKLVPGGTDFGDAIAQFLAFDAHLNLDGSLLETGPVALCRNCHGLLMVSKLRCTQCKARRNVWQDPELPVENDQCGNCIAAGRQGGQLVVEEYQCPACGAPLLERKMIVVPGRSYEVFRG